MAATVGFRTYAKDDGLKSHGTLDQGWGLVGVLCEYVKSPDNFFSPMVYYQLLVRVGHSRPSRPQYRVSAICKRFGMQ